MLVSGSAGIGKTALVREIHKHLVRREQFETVPHKYFISGKFDQSQRNIPYSALTGAFRKLVRQILDKSETQIEQWRKKIMEAAGPCGQTIIQVVPEAEAIIGPQPELQELPPAESQNRFLLTLQKFIRIFYQPEHPLVIFLDDLQRADPATLKLTEQIVTDENIQSLFLIGAYCEDEVSKGHPLKLALDALQKHGTIINHISLSPLKLKDIEQLVTDTLPQFPVSIAELAFQKTGGNPFFVSQFLQTLFNTKDSDLTAKSLQAKCYHFPDNIKELMEWKLKKLPEETLQTLRLAACLGSPFDLNTLAVIDEKSASEAFEHLRPAIAEGFVEPAGDSEIPEPLKHQTSNIRHQTSNIRHQTSNIKHQTEFLFVHDCLQKAAYALTDNGKKKKIHLRIGRLLLKNMSEEDQAKRIFELADHFIFGREMITDNREKLELLKLTLKAGRKAKSMAAYTAALQFLTRGTDRTADIWAEHYELAFDLYKERAEAEYLNGNFEQSEVLIELILNRVKSATEKAETYNLLIVQKSLQARYEEAVQNGRTALRLLSIDLPVNSGQLSAVSCQSLLQTAIGLEIAKAQENLGDRDIASLSDAPEMTLPEKKAAIKVLMNLNATTCFHNPALHSWVLAKMVNISLEHGHVPESSVSYAGYGRVLAEKGDYQTGYAFGMLGLELSRKFQNLSYISKTCFTAGAFLNHWVKHIIRSESVSTEGYEAGLASGDLQSAGYILAFNRSMNAFCQGKNLGRMLTNLKFFLRLTRKTKNRTADHIISGCQIAASNLSGLTSGKFSFETEEMSEAQYLTDCHLHKNFTALCNWFMLKSRILYLYGKSVQAFECSLKAEKLLCFVGSAFLVAEHNFYDSLILAAIYQEASREEQKDCHERMEANQNQMKIWSENCPENFLHKDLLVQAEMIRIAGDAESAIILYDKAIEAAGENEFIQDEALANELASKFWLTEGNEEIAKLYMKMAHYGYRLWGAKRKSEDLETSYPALLAPSSPGEQQPSEETVSKCAIIGDSSVLPDMATVMKASQAISGEIVLENLLKKLMDIVMETAGAEKGFLILKSDFKKDAELMVESYVSTDKDEEALFRVVPVEECKELSSDIVLYVARTCKNVVLNDAANEGDFTRDAYMMKKKPRSVLCIPIIHPPSAEDAKNKKGIIGLLYLENNRTAGTFTPDRVEVLRLLSSQAAISIDNARLYTKYHSLYENAVEGIFQSAPDGRFISANPSMARMLLYYDSPDELLTSVTNIQRQLYVYPEDCKTFERILGQEGRVIGFETQFYRKDGSVIWISESARVVRDGRGNILYYEGSVLDITARKEKNKAERAREAAEAASTAKSDFLASMSHEIRTPMNAIIGLTSLVLKTELALKQRNYLTKVNSSAYALLGILNDILDFSKIEAGKLDIRKECFQLQEVLEDIADMFVDQAAEKGIEMLIGKERDVPSALIGDPLRLKQILVNLIGNAIKFTEKGEIVLSVVCAEKTQDRAMLSFFVKDTGIGISEENIGHLFSAFTQTDSTITRKHGGTGLGLAISKKLVVLMEGDIQVESGPGRGSTFSFTLPFKRQSQEKEPAYNLISELCGLRTLIVDDDEVSRHIIKDMAPLGLEADSAASGEEALLKLKEAADRERPYQLVLMDWQLPGIDGLSTSKKIRQDPQLAGTPIVMITAYGSDLGTDLGETMGVDAFLIKPLKQSVLIDTLMEIFGRGVRGQGAEVRAEDSVFCFPGVRVLLVEDNDINRELASAILQDAGIVADTAHNGKEAVEAVTGLTIEACRLMIAGTDQGIESVPNHQQSYHAVLMDVQMPEMDGFEATRIIRKWEREIGNWKLEARDFNSHVPIIAMTAHAMKGDREKCLNAGMDDYITKPVNSETIFATLKKWINTSQNTGPGNEDKKSYTLKSYKDFDASDFGEIPGIDVESGLRRFRGNRGLFIKLLRNFAANYAGITDEIRNALAEKDMEQVHRLLHTLRGIAGNLSAKELYASVEVLRTAVTGNRPDDIEQSLCYMEEDLLRVLESVRVFKDTSELGDSEIEELTPNSASVPQSLNSLTPLMPEITRELLEIANLLSENNIAAEYHIESVRKYLASYNDVDNTYHQLESQIARFDFKGARKTLGEIAATLGVSLK